MCDFNSVKIRLKIVMYSAVHEAVDVCYMCSFRFARAVAIWHYATSTVL